MKKKILKWRKNCHVTFFPLYRREYIKKWIEIHSNDQKKNESRPTNYLPISFFLKKKTNMFFSPLG